MGGHDIFYSTLMENGKWSTPVNMGFPVNTTDDDLFYSPVGDGYIAYKSKYDDKGYGEQAIFRLEVFSDRHPRNFKVRGFVKLRDLLKEFRDSVRISTFGKMNMDTLVVVYSDPATGKYEFEIPHGEYNILYESSGSVKKVEELNLAINRSEDTVILPEMVLAKSDFIAVLELPGIDSSRKYKAGDTVMFQLTTEPNSILKADHYSDGEPVSSEEYFVNDNHFNYIMVPLVGKNRFVFTATDRFNNTTEREYSINIPRQVRVASTVAAVDVISKEVVIEPAMEVTGEMPEITDPSIDSMKLAIRKATMDDPAMEDAIVKISAKSIRNAGEWLGTLYSVAIEDGTDKEIMLRLIAAMTAGDKMNAEEYMGSLEKYTIGNLADFIRVSPGNTTGLETPEDAINYLVNSAEKGGYSTRELFEGLARMIAVENKSADDILHYFNKAQGNMLWLLWILAGAAIVTLILIVTRRRKKKENIE